MRSVWGRSVRAVAVYRGIGPGGALSGLWGGRRVLSEGRIAARIVVQWDYVLNS